MVSTSTVNTHTSLLHGELLGFVVCTKRYKKNGSVPPGGEFIILDISHKKSVNSLSFSGQFSL
jgi:hypothetical protein